MTLEELLAMNASDTQKQGVGEERFNENIDGIRDAISFWRAYPDIFVDFLCGEENPHNFQLDTSQRMFLRAAMRHRNSYFTYPRGFSKSFLAVLCMMLRCVLYPGSTMFVTSDVKKQGADILKEKVELLCNLIPGLNNEIDWRRGKTTTSKDEVIYEFKNGSTLRSLPAQPSTRGRRTTGGIVEECAQIDGDMLSEVIIPTMVIDRRLADGTTDKNDPVNQSLCFITTAGWKNTYAYDKLMEMVIYQCIYPDDYIVMGGDWRIPVIEGRQKKTFIEEQKLSGVFNEASFDREFMSCWGGDAEGTFFSSEQFDKYRILNQPEKAASGRSNKNAYYVLGVDVGRLDDQTEIVVIKVTPQGDGAYIKSIVNLWSLEKMHFEEQAIELKKAYYRYRPRAIVIDTNGLGVGLLDEMVKSQIDPENGDILPDFGLINYDEGKNENYKKYRTAITEGEIIYSLKANPAINSEAHAYVKNQMTNGKLQFLKDENEAKVKLLATKMGQSMPPEQKVEYLQPFTYTTILKEQLMNLIETSEGGNIILKKSNNSIKKDKFSALEYGLYYIRLQEQNNRGKKNRDLSKMMLFS